MKKLFTPAINLMNNLSYSRKFIVIGGLSLLALLIVSISLISYLSGSISTANQQLTGLHQTQNTSRLIQSLQQHRGISAAVIAGVYNSANGQISVNKKVNDNFLKISSALPFELKKIAKWSTIIEQWKYLNTKGITLELDENFNLHTKLIQNINSLQLRVADYYYLLVMDDLDSYYLTNSYLFTIPITLELLGQARAVGASYLVNKNKKSREKIDKYFSSTIVPLAVFKGNMHKVKRELLSDGEKISAQALIQTIEQHIQLTLDGILADSTSLSSLELYKLSTSAIDIGYQFLDNSLSFTLSNLLKNRVKQANTELIVSIGFSSTLFLIVLYFLIGLYFSTIRSINYLTKVTGKFYGGDLDARVTLYTRDELNSIALGFNEMASSFQNLLIEKEEISTRLLAIIDNSPIGIWFTGTDGRYHFVNKTFCNLVGIEEEDMLNTPSSNLAELLGSEIAHNCLDSDRAALGQDLAHVSYETIPRLNAKPYLLEITKVKLKNTRGKVVGLIGISKDITNKRQQEDDLKLADIVYQNSSEAMMITNINNEIIAINPALSDITGYSTSELIGKDPKIFSSGKQSLQFYQSMWEEIKRTGTWQGEIWNTRKNGDEYPEWLSINTIYDDDGKVFRRIALFSDITEKKKKDALILRQANYDSLTNLPNRRMFIDRLEQEIKVSHRKKQKFALIFIDLDNFKNINDTRGHVFGDQLLTEAGKRITHCVREVDTVARLGGDEFTILLSDLSEIYNVESICQKVLLALSQPFCISKLYTYISASLGVTIYPNDASTTLELLKNADQAMYLAKDLGRNQFCYFTASMQEQAQNKLELMNDLRTAISLNQLAVFYQPIIELQTGIIRKAEALLRWKHPVRGMVSPAEFIPLAEESGLIIEIGDWVFKQTVQHIKECKKQLGLDIQISINKSPVQFRETVSQLDWLTYLTENQLSGKNIVIEITEGLLMNNNTSTMEKLSRLRAADIKLSMDDFGTGYSSLSYLKKFELDYLKIDQSFTKNLAQGSEDMILSEAIITMAQKLGLKVIAEGIETEEQRKLLLDSGCDYGQGYYFSRPIPADDFLQLLARTSEI
ncbi:EAL domain-containing protein [Colwellia psychrerythraea]|uniref:Sensory box sensor/GGDEF/EAL domain protein n=1 Tax=Colwellia psychrerythraea (strain 34H / ATCC BAA-681) TaxID=167879 RepID=Q485A5_COLP3|nr:EAL domain-containing protein [Colwellia psychrerythraea]AAZ28507.1 sensory box sensor/GGDEF/EAL domain protein [Colwellia psychrerythraea 34H]